MVVNSQSSFISILIEVCYKNNFEILITGSKVTETPHINITISDNIEVPKQLRRQSRVEIGTNTESLHEPDLWLKEAILEISQKIEKVRR